MLLTTMSVSQVFPQYFFVRCLNQRELMRIDFSLCVITSLIRPCNILSPFPLACIAANVVFLCLMKEAFQEKIFLWGPKHHSNCAQIVPRLLCMNIKDFYQQVFYKMLRCPQMPPFLVLSYFSNVGISIVSRDNFTSHKRMFDKGIWYHMHYDNQNAKFYPVLNPLFTSIKKLHKTKWNCSRWKILLEMNTVWLLLDQYDYRDFRKSRMLQIGDYYKCPCHCKSQKRCKINHTIQVQDRENQIFYCRWIFNQAPPPRFQKRKSQVLRRSPRNRQK